MAIQHSGYLTDNSPPSTIASDLIKQWNDIFEWPKLTTAVAGTFFEHMERDHSKEFPVIRGAWPDWWTDGFGASARESAITRAASSTLSANVAGLSIASASGIKLPAKTAEKICEGFIPSILPRIEPPIDPDPCKGRKTKVARPIKQKRSAHRCFER